MPEVHVYVLQGQTLDQKRTLVKEITEGFVRHFDVTPEVVMIQIIENSKRLDASQRMSARRSATTSLH